MNGPWRKTGRGCFCWVRTHHGCLARWRAGGKELRQRPSAEFLKAPGASTQPYALLPSLQAAAATITLPLPAIAPVGVPLPKPGQSRTHQTLSQPS